MRRILLSCCLVQVLVAGASAPTSAAAEPDQAAKARRFTFHYRFRVHGLQPIDGDRNQVRVWLPCPSSSDFQEVTRLFATAPSPISEHEEIRYRNRILYFETRIPPTGEFTVDVPYEVIRREVLRAPGRPPTGAVEKRDHAHRAQFLRPDNLAPTTGKPLGLLAELELRTDQAELARQLYDLVDEHVTYKKDGTGWGRGDVNWVCDSRYGNCTDFHSLFMSLARSQGLPARFEMGCSIPSDRLEGPIAGYHCWAWFYLDRRGWIPVDISEADKHPELKEYCFGNLTADRLTFSTAAIWN